MVFRLAYMWMSKPVGYAYDSAMLRNSSFTNVLCAFVLVLRFGGWHYLLSNSFVKSCHRPRPIVGGLCCFFNMIN